MALIKCSKCGKEISDKSKRCIHCGARVKKQKEPVPNADAVTTSDSLLIKYLPYIFFTIGFLILVYAFGSITTRFSGVFTMVELIEWITTEWLKLGYSDVIVIFMWIYLIVMLLLSVPGKPINALAKIGYVFMLCGEIILYLVLLSANFKINIIGILIPVYTLIWIIFLFSSTKKPKSDIIYVPDEKKEDTSLDELLKLKELLDREAITQKEYNEMKKAILESELEKWD